MRREDDDSVRRHAVVLSINKRRRNDPKNGYPMFVFCPLEEGFNLEMSLGEGVGE